MIRNLLSALAFFLTLIPLAEAQGNTRYYDVELIIFERNDTASAVPPNDLGQNLALDSTTPIAQASGLRQVEGTVKVVLGRYLHVYTDLILRRPMPESFAGENRVPGIQATTDADGVGFRNLATTLHEFPMKQHRRMRSNEAHYLDHPVMGMIIIVRRAPGGA